MSYVSKNPNFNSVAFPDQGSNSVANPAAGFAKVINRNGKFFAKDSAGNEVGLGGSGSGLNVVTAPNDATGWVASGAGITVATSTTSTDLPLEGLIPTSIKLTPVSGTDYVRYRFTMPDALKLISFNVQWNQLPLAGYTSGDLKLEVYTNAASNYGGAYTKLALSTDSGGDSPIPNTTGYYTSIFSATSADYYEVRIVRVSGTTALNITNVNVSPAIQPEGGLYVPGQATGLTSGTAISAGFIGEKITSGAMSTTAVSSTTYVDVTGASITLTAGVWMIYANFYLRVDQSGGGVIACGLFDSSNVFQGGNSSLQTFDGGKSAKSFQVYKNISSSTTYKLRIAASGTTSSFETVDQSVTNDAYSTFFAVRIA